MRSNSTGNAYSRRDGSPGGGSSPRPQAQSSNSNQPKLRQYVKGSHIGPEDVGRGSAYSQDQWSDYAKTSEFKIKWGSPTPEATAAPANPAANPDYTAAKDRVAAATTELNASRPEYKQAGMSGMEAAANFGNQGNRFSKAFQEKQSAENALAAGENKDVTNYRVSEYLSYNPKIAGPPDTAKLLKDQLAMIKSLG